MNVFQNYIFHVQVLRRFRTGSYNTVVSTSVGEEGLDIGDVDLIVCFDASSSPIQLVQRMGRTGRKRNGRIAILIAEGKEEEVRIAILIAEGKEEEVRILGYLLRVVENGYYCGI